MTQAHQPLAALVGLDPTEGRLALLCEFDAVAVRSDVGVGAGLAAAAVLGAFLAALPLFQPVQPKVPQQEAEVQAPRLQLPFTVTASQKAAGVWLIEPVACEWAVVDGIVEDSDGDVALDARQSRCVLRLMDSEREFVAVADITTIRVFEVIREHDRSFDWAARWQPEAPLDIQQPDLAALLQGTPADDWLLGAARGLAESESATDRLAAIGLIARLWEPTSAEIRDAILAGKLVHPSSRVREVARSLPREQLQRLAEQAQAQASGLAGDVRRLMELAAEGDDDATQAYALGLLHRRDTLESVAVVLEDLEAGRELREALHEVDEEAEAAQSAFPEVERFAGDDRLAAVYAAEPLAWWGQFGSG
jgi:hypothetical protein